MQEQLSPLENVTRGPELLGSSLPPPLPISRTHSPEDLGLWTSCFFSTSPVPSCPGVPGFPLGFLWEHRASQSSAGQTHLSRDPMGCEWPVAKSRYSAPPLQASLHLYPGIVFKKTNLPSTLQGRQAFQDRKTWDQPPATVMPNNSFAPWNLPLCLAWPAGS